MSSGIEVAELIEGSGPRLRIGDSASSPVAGPTRPYRWQRRLTQVVVATDLAVIILAAALAVAIGVRDPSTSGGLGGATRLRALCQAGAAASWRWSPLWRSGW